MDKLNHVYLLAGGRQSNREIRSSLIQTIFKDNGIAFPKIGYIGTANRDNNNFFQRMAATLRVAGAKKVDHVVMSSDQADLVEAKKTLCSADIVFFSGGDVFEGINTLKERKMISFLQALYERGKLFFGISAGSIMLAESWVRWDDSNDASTAELFSCLGFAPIICDTHDEQDDWEELRVALQLSIDGTKGYGIVSGTGVNVNSDGKVEVMRGAIHQFVQHKGRVIRLPDILPPC